MTYQLTALSRQTKHAAELCALLVNDLHGELPSVRNVLCYSCLDTSEVVGLTCSSQTANLECTTHKRPVDHCATGPTHVSHAAILTKWHRCSDTAKPSLPPPRR